MNSSGPYIYHFRTAGPFELGLIAGFIESKHLVDTQLGWLIEWADGAWDTSTDDVISWLKDMDDLR